MLSPNQTPEVTRKSKELNNQNVSIPKERPRRTILKTKPMERPSDDHEDSD